MTSAGSSQPRSRLSAPAALLQPAVWSGYRDAGVSALTHLGARLCAHVRILERRRLCILACNIDKDRIYARDSNAIAQAASCDVSQHIKCWRNVKNVAIIFEMLHWTINDSTRGSQDLNGPSNECRRTSAQPIVLHGMRATTKIARCRDCACKTSSIPIHRGYPSAGRLPCSALCCRQLSAQCPVVLYCNWIFLHTSLPWFDPYIHRGLTNPGTNLTEMQV